MCYLVKAWGPCNNREMPALPRETFYKLGVDDIHLMAGNGFNYELVTLQRESGFCASLFPVLFRSEFFCGPDLTERERERKGRGVFTHWDGQMLPHAHACTLTHTHEHAHANTHTHTLTRTHVHANLDKVPVLQTNGTPSMQDQ